MGISPITNLTHLPQPRSIQWGAGFFVLPRRVSDIEKTFLS